MTRAPLVLLLLTFPVLGQGTTGVPGVNDLRINGVGSGGTSVVTFNAPAGTGLRAVLDAVPNAPVIVTTADQPAPRSLVFSPAYSWDIDLSTMVIRYDGTGYLLPATPLTSLIRTDATGWFRITGALPRPRTHATQWVLVGATFPLGFSSTQAIKMVLSPASVCWAAGGTDLSPLTDDGSINLTFAQGSTFTFYTAVFSDVYVNMNGNLTFGTPSSDFTPSESDFLSGPARIAPAWDDWSPDDPNQGTVRVASTPSMFSVDYFDVRHSGAQACGGGQDSNSFCCLLYLDPLGYINFGYGFMGLCGSGTAPSTNQIVGISPGGNFSGPNNVDLTQGNNAGTNGSAVYEDFGQAAFGGFDMSHLSTMQSSFLSFVPTSGGYTQLLLSF